MSQEKLKLKKNGKEEKQEQEEVKPKIGNKLIVGSEGKFDKYLKSIWLMLGDDYDEREGFFIYYPLSLESTGKQVVEATKRFACKIIDTKVEEIPTIVNGKMRTYKNVVVQIKQVAAAR